MDATKRRRYCSARCRVAANRDRQRWGAGEPAASDLVDLGNVSQATAAGVAAVLAGEHTSDPVEQLCRAVSETETLAVEYQRLAQETPRNLAWRADGMSDHLRAGLQRLFPRSEREA